MANYKTHLAKQIDLDVNEWEVGLAEFIYPHTWNNIIDGTFRIKILENREWAWKDLVIPSALYETPEQLIIVLNALVQPILTHSQQDKISFFYNCLTRKFMAYVSEGYMVRFSKEVSITLGLGDSETTLKQSRMEALHGIKDRGNRLVYNDDKIVAPLCLDLNRGLHTFFVYSDIVEYQLVGDVDVPLLRTVAVSGRNGDVIVNSFDNIHYVALSRSTFQDVQVVITDDTGYRVPFQQGRVIAKLHFRRK